MEVDLGDGHGNYSIAMYVSDITNNCILGLEYLKAREAVIDLSQGELVVNGTIVKGMYKYAECTPVRNHKVRFVNDCHLFSKFSEYGSCEDSNRRHSSGDGQARKNGPYLVPNTLLMPGDVR